MLLVDIVCCSIHLQLLMVLVETPPSPPTVDISKMSTPCYSGHSKKVTKVPLRFKCASEMGAPP